MMRQENVTVCLVTTGLIVVCWIATVLLENNQDGEMRAVATIREPTRLAGQ